MLPHLNIQFICWIEPPYTHPNPLYKQELKEEGRKQQFGDAIKLQAWCSYYKQGICNSMMFDHLLLAEKAETPDFNGSLINNTCNQFFLQYKRVEIPTAY